MIHTIVIQKPKDVYEEVQIEASSWGEATNKLRRSRKKAHIEAKKGAVAFLSPDRPLTRAATVIKETIFSVPLDLDPFKGR